MFFQFDITKVNCHSTKMMPEKLLGYNRLEIIKQIENEDSCREMVQTVKKTIADKFVDKLV